MIRQLSVLLMTVFFIGPMGGLTAACAQDDPFGADPFGSFSTTPDPAPAATVDETPTEPVDEEKDPAVLAIRDSDPQSPRELTKAADLLLKLGRPDEAKKYLDQLAAAMPDEATLEMLQQEFGSVFFLRLIGRKDVQPAGAQIGNAVLDATLKAARSPQRLGQLIDQLGSSSAATRRQATQDLKLSTDAAAAALITALAEPARASQVPQLRIALRSLGDVATDPMIAALASDNPMLRKNLIGVLAIDRPDAALPFLLLPALGENVDASVKQASMDALRAWNVQMPSRAEAIRFLLSRTTATLRGDRSAFREADEVELVWKWDASTASLQSEAVTADIATLRRATELGQQAYFLHPDHKRAKQIYHATALQTAQRSVGLDQSLTLTEGIAAEIAQLELAEMESLLQFSLDEQQNAAAAAVLRIMGAVGNETLLESRQGRLSVMARALKHPDRRVQHAAVMAILELDPREPFAGSSYLVENLAFSIRTAGTRRALVAHPRTDQAQTLIGFLADLGIRGESANVGRSVVQLAQLHPDYEFILLSEMIDDPPVAEVLQHLRRDSRTTQLPIGILARQARFAEMERMTEHDSLSETFPRPHSIEGVNLIARRLIGRGSDQQIPYDVRTRHAENALQAVQKLAQDPQRYSYFDLLRLEQSVEAALQHPSLHEQAARVLGMFGTPAAQRVLVTIASQNTRDLLQRKAAAAAFAEAIDRRGLLLTRDEVLLQYDRYNQSRTLDRETQRVLGHVLDAIESPSRESSSSEAKTAAVES